MCFDDCPTGSDNGTTLLLTVNVGIFFSTSTTFAFARARPTDKSMVRSGRILSRAAKFPFSSFLSTVHQQPTSTGGGGRVAELEAELKAKAELLRATQEDRDSLSDKCGGNEFGIRFQRLSRAVGQKPTTNGVAPPSLTS